MSGADPIADLRLPAAPLSSLGAEVFGELQRRLVVGQRLAAPLGRHALVAAEQVGVGGRQAIAPPGEGHPSEAWAVEARDLVLAYGERRAPSTGSGRALDGVSLQVRQGSVFGLLGPNGSGKTSLLSALVGLLTPQAGSVRVLGQAPMPAVRGRVGIVFQESCLDPLMTVEETLRLHGRLFGLPRSVLRQRIAELLARFELADRAGQATRTLSGGLKRRLELARALLPSPVLLLLDEPTTGLDPDARLSLWEHLTQANAAGATVVLATNYVAEAERYCDTVAFLHAGRLVAQGSPAELKRDLKHDSVRVEWPGCSDGLLAALAARQGVGKLTWAPPVLHVTVDSASAFIPELFRLASGGGGDRIRGIRVRESTLEDAYFQIVRLPLSPEGGD